MGTMISDNREQTKAQPNRNTKMNETISREELWQVRMRNETGMS